ncbi:hypothetical protein BWI17_02370 [Betaproteobacteria bacterium GR16-43]|nr:hypothetical protein BWI17_02370 [Betaproteobacteria bacterium GR16-43]
MRFRGASSIVAVCAFCRATLVRDGVNIENIGKQAELLEDDSPIRIGADGKHRGVGFSVVGRLQYKYGAGVWSEWHVLFGGGKSAWLSDAMREYTLTYLVPPQPLPAFETLKAGQKIVIKGEQWYAGSYTVMNVDAAEVVAGEGELPFRWTSGYKANVVDLRGDGARFATIDYSLTPPHLYVGEKLPFDAFGFSGLRDPGQIGFTKGTAQAFKCAGCGAPIEKRLTTTEVVACDSCGSITDVKGTVGEIVQKNTRNENKARPYFPLGTMGRWKNVRYEVMGFMTRTVVVDGVSYGWGEYLLHNVEQGYAWITEYNGHFSFVKTAAEIPKETSIMVSSGGPAVRYLGHTFKHFSRSTASVNYVVGEFYWRVMVGDVARCDDYVDPPLMLSSEATAGDLSWSVGEYVEGPELFKAFALKAKPPKPEGVAPNQPSPHKGKVGRYWMAFGAFVVLAFFAQMLFSTLQSARRPDPVPFAAQAGQTARTTSEPFKLGGFGSGRAIVRTTTNLTDNWLSLDMQLVDADNGRAYALKRSLGFHNVGGVKDGSKDDVAEIAGVPPGRYTLAIDALSPPGEAGKITGTVQVYRAKVDWSNFWLFTGYLFLWPLGAWLRSRAFETKRWSESDYASTSSDDDDDDD